MCSDEFFYFGERGVVAGWSSGKGVVKPLLPQRKAHFTEEKG